MIAAPLVKRVPPGALPADLWALRPARLVYRDGQWSPDDQPALVVREPQAVTWLALSGEDLVLFGPYGDVSAFGALIAEACGVSAETGRARLVASVRNDEVERFEGLQRLGFVLVEARLGALSPDSPGEVARAQMWGDIATRDELVLARVARRH